MIVTVATWILYPVETDTGIADDDAREEGPEIHLAGLTGIRGHINEDDCDNLDCNLHKAKWTTYSDG